MFSSFEYLFCEQTWLSLPICQHQPCFLSTNLQVPKFRATQSRLQSHPVRGLQLFQTHQYQQLKMVPGLWVSRAEVSRQDDTCMNSEAPE